MVIRPDSAPADLPASGNGPRAARSPEEAARQFEEIFIRQFVQVMTKDLFKSPLSGEGGPGWVQGQADLQADVLTDVLSKHLTDAGGLRLRELLLRQWDERGADPIEQQEGRAE